MRFLFSSIPALIAASSLTAACSPPSQPADPDTSNPFEFGSGAYPPLETIGFKINHACLNVNNLTASLDFYTNILGLSHIFTFHAADYFKIVYLGHISGGVNGSGYQTPEEQNREKNNQKGLLELVWLDPEVLEEGKPLPPLVGPTQKSNTFSHFGLIVPDVPAMQERVINAGVEVVKKVGETIPNDRLGAVAVSYGLDRLPPGKETDQILAGILSTVDATGGLAFLMINDPDGNLIEVQPLIEEIPGQQ
ncbi:glyoxalase/Bleomycin resistance protein/Dioxygenase superfamily protein [Sarocladium implicatum]|nr:glyoxalase/Bleomycin resistance protein/Dioxygenase superfamily protein [Sarocladium implicatum]